MSQHRRQQVKVLWYLDARCVRTRAARWGEQAGKRGRGQRAWRQQPAGPEAAPLGEGTEQRKDTLDLGCNGVSGAGPGAGRPAGVSGACGEGILRRE